MSLLVLLRHGQSQWNLENRFTGWHDVDLSPLGEEEARTGGARMHDIRFDVVFTSTLKRAIRTAEIALEASGPVNAHLREGAGWKLIRHDDLRERHYGDLVGLDKAETAQKFGDEQVRLWRRSYSTRPPAGESLEDVVARVTPYWEAHIRPEIEAGRNVLVAAHGNTVRALLVVLGERTTEEIPTVEIPTGVPLVFDYADGEFGKGRYLEGDAD
ncbi:MAG: 2,3-diphosphoglycerate-dependent phosphoglycerate mutase [Alphaproteobacteria bacterium]